MRSILPMALTGIFVAYWVVVLFFTHDSDKNYFTGKTHLLKDIFLEHGLPLIQTALDSVGWKASEIDFLITHQVSEESLKAIVKGVGICPEKCIQVFH